MKEISPSILNADFLKINEVLKTLNSHKIKSIHLDIMDGVFVPNLTFGPGFIKQLKPFKENLEFISHLMIVNPEKYFEDYINAGSDGIVFHQEAVTHLHSAVMKIKSSNKKVGIALNPGTPVTVLSDVIHLLDEVLLMSVNPGFGGQEFIPRTFQKIEELVQILEDRNLDNIRISLDGGVNLKNIEELFETGVDIAVVGSAIFNSPDIPETLKKFIDISERF
ncbi:MAG: ribulose-phosphate 3-epimerase [bacterium]|nr:ribulose-phosphate 3-epimerase [bacterium]